MRTACIMKMQATRPSVHGNLIPQYSDLRRLPMGYQHILPLEVMKRYHCAVVGSAQGVLTVAITDQHDPSLVETLSRLTGRPIFPVWVKPERMRLLIQRMECWEHRRNDMLHLPHFLSLFQIHTIAVVLTDQMKERK
jgi:type II secretion system (T2SS) protein E